MLHLKTVKGEDIMINAVDIILVVGVGDKKTQISLRGITTPLLIAAEFTEIKTAINNRNAVLEQQPPSLRLV